MPEAKPNAPEESLAGILWTVALTTALVVAAAWWVPAAHAATAVGIVFLGAVYLKLLHRGSDERFVARGSVWPDCSSRRPSSRGAWFARGCAPCSGRPR